MPAPLTKYMHGLFFLHFGFFQNINEFNVIFDLLNTTEEYMLRILHYYEENKKKFEELDFHYTNCPFNNITNEKILKALEVINNETEDFYGEKKTINGLLNFYKPNKK